jgi:FtsH-binding integral membrane protein
MYQSTDLEYGQPVQGQAVYVYDGKQPITQGISVNVRHGFIRKVYSILFIQLLLTSAIAAPFVLLDQTVIRNFVVANSWLMWLSLALSFTFMIIFACFPSLMRKYPLNYFILFLFTATEGLFVGLICSTYSVQSVLLALVTVTGITLALTLFAFQTKYDFTGWGPYLLVATLVLLVFGFVLIFVRNEIAQKVYCGIGALVFSLYLVYDTQLIAGGSHRKHQFNVDDYAMAAICLYIDIIQLFIYLLALMGNRR